MSIRQRLDGIVRIPDKYRVKNPPCPKSVKIELTTRCNYNCGYCGHYFRKDKRQDMDFNLFKRITAEMRKEGVEEFGVFYIGEPFMAPTLLVDCVKYLKNDLQAPYVFVTSNASLANPRYIKDCMESGIDSVKWSCNAADAGQAEILLGINERTFDETKHNIKNAFLIRKLNNFKTKLYASSIKYDDEHVERMKPFLNEYILPYVDEHYWLPLFTMGGVANDHESELGLQPVAGNPGRCDSPVDPIPCWTLFTAAHVLSDGRLTACCMDATGNWVMGDLNKNSFMECWNTQEFQALRTEHLRLNVIGTKCQKCVLVS